MSVYKPLFVLLFLSLGLSAFAAPDLAREKRIAEQITDAVFDGDVVYLADGPHEFMAIYTRTERSPARGAALILHGKGAHPDWVDVVQPLRTGLTEHGWETLSIQLPVAHEGASDAEWLTTVEPSLARIDAAIEFLQKRNMLNVVMVAHSFGNRAATRYIASKKEKSPIQALAAIGMSANPDDRQSGNLGALRNIKIPVYDLYGERDLDSVLGTAKERRLAAIDAANKNYRQYEMADADHFFVGQEDALVATVRAWLFKVASGTEVKLK